MSGEVKGYPLLFFDKPPLWQIRPFQTKVGDTIIGRGKARAFIKDRFQFNYPPLFSKSVAIGSNMHSAIEAKLLDREYYLLLDASASGITPRPLILKKSPDGKKLHLLLEHIPGVTLKERKNPTASDKSKFTKVLEAAFASSEKLIQQNIFAGDIDESNLLFNGLDQTNGQIDCYILDLGEAIRTIELDYAERRTRIADRYCQHDPGFAITSLDEIFLNSLLTPALMAKAERFSILIAVINFYIGTNNLVVPWKELSKQDRKRLEKIHKDYRESLLRLAKVKRDTLINFLASEGHLTINDLKPILNKPLEIKEDLNIISLPITLPYLLKRAGITVDDELLNYMIRTLNPNFQQRPKDYFKR